MTEAAYSNEIIKQLIESKLPWEQLKPIVSGYKDEDRFDKYIEVLQEKVPWPERILLPFTNEIYIVEKGQERVAKCSCGYEFGDYRENWKLKALIHVRDSQEEIDELYPPTYPSQPDRELCEVREYYCPECGSQLEVEAVPFGYPAIFDFLPDLDTFYRQWLGRPLATEQEFKDFTSRFIEGWDER